MPTLHPRGPRVAVDVVPGHFADFFENANVAMHWVDPDGAILAANRAELEMLGYASGEYVGHNIAEFHTGPGVAAETLAPAEPGEHLIDYPARLRARDGSTRVVAVSSSALFEDGKFVHTRCITRDVTAERRANRLLAAQYGVSSLLTSASGLGDVAAEVLAILGEGLDWGAAAIWLLDGQALRARAFWAADEAGAVEIATLTRSLALGAGVGLPGQVWAESKPRWIGDLATAERLPRTAAAVAAGLHGALAVPIRADRFYGVLEGFVGEPLPADSPMLGAVQHVGEQIGGFLQRLQREADAAHLSAIVASSDDAIASKDLNGIVRSWNPAAERIFGFRPDEIVGRSIRMIIPPERQQEEDEVLARIRRGDRVEHFETLRRRKDGREIAISLTVSPIRDAAGRVVGASKVARDIGPQKRAEAMLRRSEERQRALIAAIPMKLALMGPNRLGYYWNDNWVEYLGCGEGDLLSQGLEPFIHPDDRERVEGALRELPQRATEPLLLEVRYRRADGAYRWHLASTVAFRGPEGEDGWLAVATDIQAIKEAEELLQRTIEAKDEFLGLASHELRTPLTQILGNAEIVARFQNAADPAAVADCLAEIHREARRLNRLVENMLLVSRLERGVLMETEPQLVQRMVAQVVGEFRRLFPLVTLDVAVADDLPPVASEAVSFQQVLWNLLTNAAKYASNAGPVVLRASADARGVVVTVSDSGPGVAEDELASIFDPYVRARDVSPAAAGLGLGLSVCRRLIEAQAGRMWGRPRPGGGMEFGFALPALEAAEW